MIRGSIAFRTYCVLCHGTAGKGDGRAAKMYTPRPANLTVSPFPDQVQGNDHPRRWCLRRPFGLHAALGRRTHGRADRRSRFLLARAAQDGNTGELKSAAREFHRETSRLDRRIGFAPPRHSRARADPAAAGAGRVVERLGIAAGRPARGIQSQQQREHEAHRAPAQRRPGAFRSRARDRRRDRRRAAQQEHRRLQRNQGAPR